MARSRSKGTTSSSAAAASARSSFSPKPSSSSPAAAIRELRGRGTIATLAALAEGGWIDAEARDALTAAYYFLRRVEHRLQMMADEQTHTLPSDSRRAWRIRPLSRLRRSRRFRRGAAGASCTRSSSTTSNCSSARRPFSPSSKICRSSPPTSRATRSTGWRSWASGNRKRSRPRCAAGAPANTGRCAASRRATI